MVALCVVGFAFSANTFAKDAKKDETTNIPTPRVEPASMSSGDQTALNKAADLLNDGKDSEAQTYVEKVLRRQGQSLRASVRA